MELVNYTSTIVKFFPAYLYSLNTEWIAILVSDSKEEKETIEKISENYDKLAKFDITIIKDKELFELIKTNPKNITKEMILQLKDPSFENSIAMKPFLFFLIFSIYLYLKGKKDKNELKEEILKILNAEKQGNPMGKQLYKEMQKELSELE